MKFDLEAIKARCEAANEWRPDTQNKHRSLIIDGYAEVIVTNCAGPGYPHAADIAADIYQIMRTDLPLAIAEIERLREALHKTESLMHYTINDGEMYTPGELKSLLREMRDDIRAALGDKP